MTQSRIRSVTAHLTLLLSLSTASACAVPASRFPPRADLVAATEAKPRPTADIVTDSKASAEYNAAVESWGDRVGAAGGRLCRYFREIGMKVDCPEPTAP
jgi:hypothetical protein